MEYAVRLALRLALPTRRAAQKLRHALLAGVAGSDFFCPVQPLEIAVAVTRSRFFGATGALLDRSMISLRDLIDRSLVDVRTAEAMPVRRQLLSVATFFAEAKVSASLEARARGCRLTVDIVYPMLMIEVDRHLLSSAIGNLLQNAFKFSAPGSEVSLKAYPAGDRVLIDVEDSCGGLPAGKAENMFKPFTQRSADKSGMGLGLSICRRAVEANNGVVRVRDQPGTGCVFTIDLPRSSRYCS